MIVQKQSIILLFIFWLKIVRLFCVQQGVSQYQTTSAIKLEYIVWLCSLSKSFVVGFIHSTKVYLINVLKVNHFKQIVYIKYFPGLLYI